MVSKRNVRSEWKGRFGSLGCLPSVGWDGYRVPQDMQLPSLLDQERQETSKLQMKCTLQPSPVIQTQLYRTRDFSPNTSKLPKPELFKSPVPLANNAQSITSLFQKGKHLPNDSGSHTIFLLLIRLCPTSNKMPSFKIFHQDPALSLYKLLFHYFICLTNTSPGQAVQWGLKRGWSGAGTQFPPVEFRIYTHTQSIPVQWPVGFQCKKAFFLAWQTSPVSSLIHCLFSDPVSYLSHYCLRDMAMILLSFSVIYLLQILQHKSIKIPFLCF